MCHQIDLTPMKDLLCTIEAVFKTDENTEIIVSNMLLDKYQIGAKKSELQKRIR